jgi:putative CocE/NonD family hydrolase
MAKSKRESISRDVTRGGDIPRTFKAQTADFNYTRTEAMVPMRDGVKLFTLILIPDGSKAKMPIVLTRTPYNAKSRASGNSPDIATALRSADDQELVRDGYIRVFQDIRGRFGSKGKYTMTMPVRGPFNESDVDQSTDAWDTVDWLVNHVEGNNGRVGITGTSYDGLLTVMARG